MDAVVRVHLKGHFATMRHASEYWRGEAKDGRMPSARVINTSSGAGLQGSVGHSQLLGREGGDHGSDDRRGPGARTLRSDGQRHRSVGQDPDDRGPVRGGDGDHGRTSSTACIRATCRRSSPGWPARTPGDVTGRVIEVEGGGICVEEGWRHGPSIDAGRRWTASEVGPALRELLRQAQAPEPVYGS